MNLYFVPPHENFIDRDETIEPIKSWSPEDETYSLVKWFASYNPEEEARKELYIKNCPYIEYEQDMGANIPFCQIDGNMCNGQCLKSP